MTGLTMYLSCKQVCSGSRLCEINDGSSAIWPEDSMTRFVVVMTAVRTRCFPERLNKYLGEEKDPS